MTDNAPIHIDPDRFHKIRDAENARIAARIAKMNQVVDDENERTPREFPRAVPRSLSFTDRYGAFVSGFQWAFGITLGIVTGLAVPVIIFILALRALMR